MQPDSCSILTPRLELRPYREADFESALALWSDARVFFWRAAPYTREEARAAFERLLQLERERGLGGWGIRGKEESADNFLGEVRLQPAVFDGSDGKEIEIAYFLHKAAQGHGYAREAASALLDHGFRNLALPRIVALVLPSNVASLHLVERLGMTLAGERLHAGLVHRYFVLERGAFRRRQEPA